jgi:hypothetical protein
MMEQHGKSPDWCHRAIEAGWPPFSRNVCPAYFRVEA